MERLTPEILKAAAKGLRHFATGFRTLSKIPALLMVSGDQNVPRNRSCESTEEIPALLMVSGDENVPRNRSCESTEEPVPQSFHCKPCDYTCTHRGDWKKHLAAQKHKKFVSDKTAPFFSEIAPPQPKEFLLSSYCKWGVGLPREVLKFLLGTNLRANRFHDQWVTHRDGWRTISENDFTKIGEFVGTFFQECKLLLTDHGTLQAFEVNVGPVRASKWNRRNKMLDSKLDMSAFVRYARDMHKILRPLK